MFKPKVIGIIGNRSKMAQNIVIPLFKRAGYEVIGSDIKNPEGFTNEEVVQKADVVYFLIMPIANVASTMLELICYAKPESLWLHGTSIQNPVKSPIKSVLLSEELKEKKVDVGYLHFMVGPNISSLNGQSIIYGFYRDLINPSWKKWLVDLLDPERALVLNYAPDIHDKKTTGSQLIPMIASLVEGSLLRRQRLSLEEVLKIAGPPGWFQFYGMLRSLSQKNIVANIVVNHPSTKKVIEDAIEILQAIRAAHKEGDEIAIENIAEEGLTIATEETLKHIKESTNWHIGLEGDMRGGAVCFVFSKKENITGLLTKVSWIFDKYGVDKTSCRGQETADGGCKFYIALKVGMDDSRVKKACDEIIINLRGKLVAV